jgi:hypothetical protein
MSMTVIAEIRKKVFEIFPDGRDVPWDEAYPQAPAEFRKIVDAMTFGKPDTIRRNGNQLVANAKQGATLPPIKGFTAYAESQVRCKIHPISGGSMKVTDITGIEIETPVGGRFKVTNATIGIDKDGNFLLSSTKFLVFTVTVTISPAGEYLGWKLG